MKVAMGTARPGTSNAGQRCHDRGAPVDGLDKSGLRDMADSLKSPRARVIVLASESDGKVSIVVSVTKPRPSIAGKIVKQIAPIVGGDAAEAGLAEAGGRTRTDDDLRRRRS
jgi:alanyl-tRNA synthetase